MDVTEQSSEQKMDSVLPFFAEGTVVSGFGRGSKELGIPTANFPEDVIKHLPSSFECGVYYGWAKVGQAGNVHGMTMCVGWNPYYHNTVKTMETHILHTFEKDFYGEHLKIAVVGFLRPMCDFDSLDALIKAIHRDNDNAKQRLALPENQKLKTHQFFSADFDGSFVSGCKQLSSTSSSSTSSSSHHHSSSNRNGAVCKDGSHSKPCNNESSRVGEEKAAKISKEGQQEGQRNVKVTPRVKDTQENGSKVVGHGGNGDIINGTLENSRNRSENLTKDDSFSMEQASVDESKSS